MTADTNTIIELENRFWQSMQNKDAKAASVLIAKEGLVAGPQGVMKIDPKKYEKMTDEGKWSLKSFELSDVEVVFPTKDTALIGYTVHQTGEVNHQPMDLHCADTSVWVRSGKEWKCSLHTETLLEKKSDKKIEKNSDPPKAA